MRLPPIRRPRPVRIALAAALALLGLLLSLLPQAPTTL